ncbi:MAG: hypothetical protein ACW97V_18865 [Promethearchaeota archaeon]
MLAKTNRNPSKPSQGIAMFVIDRETTGVSLGRSEELMGRHCTSLDGVIFENVKIPEENLLILPALNASKNLCLS